MNRVLSLIVLASCILLSTVGVAQSNSLPSKAEQDVRSLVEEIDSALKSHDRAKLDHLLAADFTMVHSTGKVEDRDSFLGRAAAGLLASQRFPAEIVEDTIRVYDNRTALRTTRVKATLHPADRPETEMSFRSIDVYVKIDGRWLWVSEQSTNLPSEAPLTK